VILVRRPVRAQRQYGNPTVTRSARHAARAFRSLFGQRARKSDASTGRLSRDRACRAISGE
jgi:hypothetical protein